MRTTTRWTLVALSAVALVGVAAAATPQGQQTTDSLAQTWRAHLRAFHQHPVQSIDKVCSDDITWGECKALLHEKVEEFRGQAQQKVEQRYQECLEAHDQSYCDGRLDQFKADHPNVYGNQTSGPGSA